MFYSTLVLSADQDGSKLNPGPSCLFLFLLVPILTGSYTYWLLFSLVTVTETGQSLLSIQPQLTTSNQVQDVTSTAPTYTNCLLGLSWS